MSARIVGCAKSNRGVTTPSTTEVEARSYELDPYGHLNNAVYVNWLEHGRSAWLRERELTWTNIPEKFGVRVVIVHLDLDFQAEIGLHDRLEVATSVSRVGNSSFTFRQQISFLDGPFAAEATAVMVCITGDGTSPIPDGLRALLEG